jgi:hypothetical protein
MQAPGGCGDAETAERDPGGASGLGFVFAHHSPHVDAASEERGSRVRHALGMQWAGMICQVRRSVLVVRHIDPEPLPERPQDGLSFGARESPMRRHEQAMAAVRAALQQEHTTSTSPLLPIPLN